MDTSEVGITAAQLMDELAEGQLPEGAKVLAVGLVVELEYEEGGSMLRDVRIQSSIDDRVRQIGLFETAKFIALDSGEEEA